MRRLLRETTAYKAICSDEARGTLSQSALVVFADGKYLRSLLKECAKAFFGAADGSRVSDLIEKEIYADCLFFPADGQKLTADDCVKIIDESLLRPVEGEKKLFVLDSFDAVTPLLQNKLLKILEEPPQGVGFLLGAKSEYPVLPTVRSRMKKYVVPPFSEEQIEGALARNYPQTDVKQAAAASGGVYSAAETLLQEGERQFALAREFLSCENIVAFCRTAGEEKEKKEFFSALTLTLRDMMFLREGQAKYAAMQSLSDLAKEYPTGAILSALSLVREAEQQVEFNANFAQCLFALALGIRKEKEKWQKLS